MRKTLLITLSILISFTGLNAQTTRVLFLGNSYTYVNNLDQMVKDFALAMGDTLEVQRNTPGGYTLGHPDGGHIYNETSLSMIAEGGWDYVVLQDQSQFPTIPYYRDLFSYTGTLTLDNLIREASPCAKPVMFMTWGRKYGGQQCIGDHCSADFVDFFHMQDTLEESYMHMALSIDGYCAPVGVAWGAAISDGDPINLFSGDNSHPSLAGTYLAACTFYATLTGNSPVGCTYTAGLDEDIALFLQQKADSVVLQSPEQWNIVPPNPQAGFEYVATDYEVSFTDISNFGQEYHWDFGDPASGDHNFSDERNPMHIFYGQGTYIVTQTVSDECFSVTFTDTLQVVNTGINTGNPKVIWMYPNPAKERLNIELHEGHNFSLMELKNIQNQVVLRRGIHQKNIEINISDLNPGIYIIHLKTHTDYMTHKIIIY